MPVNTTRKAIIPIGPSIAYIPLTQGQFALVDREDAELLQRWNWFAQWNPCTSQFYAGRQRRLDDGRRRQETRSMQAEILGLSGRKMTADHVNRIGLDNRRINIRIATRTQQKANQGRRKDNRSGYTGVGQDGQTGKWRATVCKDGVAYYLGRFPCPEDAHAAYQRKAAELFGEFAAVPR